MGEVEERKEPIFRDIRRYFCDYCGICRSKKTLIKAHMLSCHQEEMQEQKADDKNEETRGEKSNTCEECGASFKKPAYLKQHMQSHSVESYLGDRNAHGCYSVKHWIPQKELQNARGCMFYLEWTSIRWGDLLRSSIKWPHSRNTCSERPFTCPVDDCPSSYRRKDHLTRHLLQHQGKLFTCPVENCNRRFAFQSNIKRHVKEFHDEESPRKEVGAKKYVCTETGCGKVFQFASKLQKHEDSHVKLDSVEAICAEPGCFKYFTNEECLKAHIRSCHQHVTCEICSTKQLKKNIKRHLRTHETPCSSERIKCHFDGCLHTFSTKSNLQQHVNAVHHELRPFVCGIPGCGMRFPFKHVRDNHEKTGCHVYTLGDFVELDEQFRQRPRGGRKRKCPPIEALLRKRVTPPSHSDSILADSSEYLSWLLHSGAGDQ